MYIFLSTLNVVAQNITVELIEPDPTSQQFPCPNQTVIYECRVLVESSEIVWVLPTNDNANLRFLGTEMSGTTRSAPDGKFIATLIESVPVEGTSPVRYLINSTLHIQPPLDNLNGSSLTCAGGTTGQPVMETITITLSGE